MSTIYDWSLTASENGNADHLINWCEGQAPNSVNNSARFMMQRMREYLSDTGGTLEGVVRVDNDQQTTVIRLRSNAPFSAYKNGLSLCFKAKGENVGATKIVLNTLAEKPVHKATATGLSALSGGEIQGECLYSVVYDEELSGWQLLNPTKAKGPVLKSLPPGLIGAFGMEQLPSGWLICDGRAYSRIDYWDLFSAIGTTWGAGDGSNTFNVPDFRGMFLRGMDYERNIDPWRNFASYQSYSLKDHDHFIGSSVSAHHSSRKKRSVVVDYVLTEQREIPSDDEECAGLTGDAYDMCNQSFDSATDISKAKERGFWFTESDKPARLPSFMRKPFSPFICESTPLREGVNDDFHHEHQLLTERVGGSETRPVNVSIVFGIKT